MVACLLCAALCLTVAVASGADVGGDFGVEGAAAEAGSASCPGTGEAVPRWSARTMSLMQFNTQTKKEAIPKELFDQEEDDAPDGQPDGQTAGAGVPAELFQIGQEVVKGAAGVPAEKAARQAASEPAAPAAPAIAAAAKATPSLPKAAQGTAPEPAAAAPSLPEASARPAPPEPPSAPATAAAAAAKAGSPELEPPLSSFVAAAEGGPQRSPTWTAASLRLRAVELAQRLGGSRKGSLLLLQYHDGGFNPKMLVLAILVGTMLLCASVAMLRVYHVDQWTSSVPSRVHPPLMAADVFACPAKSRVSEACTPISPRTPRRWSLVPPPHLPRGVTPELGSAVVAAPKVAESREGSPTSQQRPLEPDYFFCRDLVVPPTCECILKVPIQPPSQGPFNVTDLNDNMVLRIEPRAMPARNSVAFPNTIGSPETEGGAPVTYRLVMLTSFGHVLAQCGLASGRSVSATRGEGPEAPAGRTIPEFHLLKGTGELFAKLTRTDLHEQQYTLIDRTGKSLYFWGDLENHVMNVSGESRKLVARTEIVPESVVDGRPGCYKVQVAPLMDVGLVLCGLLCIDSLT